jgi:hypothetical protein
MPQFAMAMSGRLGTGVKAHTFFWRCGVEVRIHVVSLFPNQLEH